MKRLILPFILVLAFCLRIFFLTSIPAGFTPDEASFGYDAYSILNTGKDQWGKTFPILFESFGDYKSPIYGYLAIPSVAVFGLNKFAVRLPSAILGTFAVLITYLLVKELLGTKKNLSNYTETLSLYASFWLAISSWHIALSRGAFEANLTTFFLPLGIYFLLKSFSNQKYLLYSVLIFGVNMFTYHSAKLITPILVIVLVLLYKRDIYKNISRKIYIYSSIIFLTFFAVTLFSFFVGGARRAIDINIYNGSLNEAFDSRQRLIGAGSNGFVAHLVYNKYTVTLKRFYINYTSYLSPRFLFIKGPAEATYGMIPGFGVLYGIEIVFLFAFIYSLITQKKKESIFILFWILISPIPAALSSGVGYAANRVAIMMPAIQIASAMGLMVVLEIVARFKFGFRLIALVAVFGLLGLNAYTFMKNYFNWDNPIVARQMLFGNLEVIDFLNANYPNKKILLSTGLSEPHIYWAFETKYDPKMYQSSTKLWNYKDKNLPFLDQLSEYNLGNVVFKRIDWKFDPKNSDVLVGRPDEFPRGILITKVFYYPDSTPALYLVDTKNQSYANANYAKPN